MIGRHDGKQQVDLTATVAEWELLSTQLLNVNGEFEFTLRTDGVKVEPWAGLPKRLRVKLVETHSLLIEKVDEDLIISGSPVALRYLTSSLRSICDEAVEHDSACTIPPHMHLEYYDGHFFLDSKSIALIITLGTE